MNAITDPNAYADHLAQLARSDDEPERISWSGPAFCANPPKPKREWRVTKAGLLTHIAMLERTLEAGRESHANVRALLVASQKREQRLAALCLFLAAFAAVVGVR